MINSLEYEARLRRDFVPPTIKQEDLNKAVPPHLLRPDTTKSLLYILKDLSLATGLVALVLLGDKTLGELSHFGSTWSVYGIPIEPVAVSRTTVWVLYWFFQGLVGAGIFCLGHDAGHQSLTPYGWLNDSIGFLLHTGLLIPYFAWKATHSTHHKNTGSMTKDEVYVPRTREQLGLPVPTENKDASNPVNVDYWEFFEDAPITTLVRVFIMQICGWWLYLMFNTLGSPMYPPWTNHFNPRSPLFKPKLRPLLILSDVALVGMLYLLCRLSAIFGAWTIFKLYGIPYILTNHWIVLFTYLHHSDPSIPHYNGDDWTWLRGALTTVDRPLLGWMGRFFLHNISHDHVAHHLFLRVPFYNAPAVTTEIKKVLGEDYNYDSTNTFVALWRSFKDCLYVEGNEPIAFYRNKNGVAARRVAEGYGAKSKHD